MDRLINKQFIVRVLRNRAALALILLAIQFQFFTINLLNAYLRAPDEGWELKIAAIDDHITPQGVWLVPYFVGFFLAGLVPLWAMFHMPNTLYRQFVLAMLLAAVFGYVIYLAVPTYVTKPAPHEVPGDDLFARWLRSTYEVDAAASTHNAAPSQHVFYALLNMCFMIRFRPRPRVFWRWVALAALITASTLLTRRHNSPDLITGYAVAVGAYYSGLALGARATAWLGDANGPIVVPLLPRYMPRRLRRRLLRDISPDVL